MKKILIVGPSWVGDMVMAQTLFKQLKCIEPAVQIDVLAPDWTRALLNRMPEINRAISAPLKHGELNLKKRWQIGRALKKENYDQAIVLPNSLKSALIPFFAGIKKRTGWRGEMRYGFLNDLHVLNKETLPLMIERFMALALPSTTDLSRPYPAPKLIIDKNSLENCLAKHQLDIEKPIFALCPGAEFGPAKRWPIEYFSEIAKQKFAEGYQVWLFGSRNDLSMAAELQRSSGDVCVNLIGKTSLDEAIDLLSLAEIVLSNDSGLMHIAAALEKPMVALYGSTSTEFTPPLGDNVKILKLNLDCQPCFKRECPLGHFKCMKDLKPSLVVKAVGELKISRDEAKQ